MIFNQNCYNLNIKYYEDLIKVDIENIKNNIENFEFMGIFYKFKYN